MEGDNGRTGLTDPELGRLQDFLGPDYRDIRPMAEGGLSRLYRAFRVSLGVEVVIKQMKADPRRAAGGKREAEALISLRHQYLPRIFAFESDDRGYSYIIMEYIPGMNLREYVLEYGAQDQKQTVKWYRQLCETVAYMHSRKIRHCDIKPGNIMITPEGNICLIDFNTALLGEEDRAAGLTRGYAAPEQYNVPLRRGRGNDDELTRAIRQAKGMGKVGDATDVFAMGAVAYFMLTGYDPAPWYEPQIPLTRYRIVLGDALRGIIEQSMQPEIRRRFPSAQAVLDALNGLESRDRRWRTWVRTCRVTMVIILTGLILSGFAAVQGALRLRTEHGEAYTKLVTQAQQETDPAAAEELYFRAVDMDRDRPDAYAGLGALYYEKGEYRQAADMLSQVDPDRTGGLDDAEAARMQGQIQYLLGSCLYQLEEYDQALKAYETAVYFGPEEAAWQRDLAVCYARLGQVERAEETLQVLGGLSLLPGDAELVTGEIRYARGDTEGALEQLTIAARSSENPEVVLRAALQGAACSRDLGDTAGEIALLQDSARRLNTVQSAPLLQLEGEAHMRLAAEDPDGAGDHYEDALSCFSTLAERSQATFAVRENMALVLEYLDRLDEAREVLLALAADFPSDYRPVMRLALLSWDVQSTLPASSRNFDEFRSYYEQAKSLYTGAEPDSDMQRLEEFASRLP